MATARPVVSVYKHDDAEKKRGTVVMPHVMMCPLRPDLIRFVHDNTMKNTRQARGVKMKAGYDTAAESWGTGRAVARIPRAPGGGTHRAGQGAFGNMCRGGGMFAPLRTWRRWHRKINLTKRRHAVASAIAASALPPLVQARGHRIGEVPELPLVVSDDFEKVTKTKEARKILEKLGAKEDMKRVNDSRQVRKGKGKRRNRRHVCRKGPMVVYNKDEGISKAVRNLPGVDCQVVTRLSLLKLAPGGHFGRFIVWTEGAMKTLNKMYGSTKTGAPLKRKYTLPSAIMENTDLDRIINSSEVQAALRPKIEAPVRHMRKVNALRSKEAKDRLNPAAAELRAKRTAECTKGTPEHKAVQAAKAERVKAARAYCKKYKKGDDTYYKKLMKAFEPKPKAAEEEEGEDDE